MNTSVIDKATGAKVDAGDAANKAVRVSVVAVPEDASGSLAVADSETERDREALESMLMLARSNDYHGMAAGRAEQRIPTDDSRGGCGQRGSVR